MRFTGHGHYGWIRDEVNTVYITILSSLNSKRVLPAMERLKIVDGWRTTRMWVASFERSPLNEDATWLDVQAGTHEEERAQAGSCMTAC